MPEIQVEFLGWGAQVGSWLSEVIHSLKLDLSKKKHFGVDYTWLLKNLEINRQVFNWSKILVELMNPLKSIGFN